MIRFLLLLLASTPALAQYQGPAVESCRAYALKELKRDGNQAKDVLFERDVLIERGKPYDAFVEAVVADVDKVFRGTAPAPPTG